MKDLSLKLKLHVRFKGHFACIDLTYPLLIIIVGFLFGYSAISCASANDFECGIEDTIEHIWGYGEMYTPNQNVTSESSADTWYHIPSMNTNGTYAWVYQPTSPTYDSNCSWSYNSLNDSLYVLTSEGEYCHQFRFSLDLSTLPEGDVYISFGVCFNGAMPYLNDLDNVLSTDGRSQSSSSTEDEADISNDDYSGMVVGYLGSPSTVTFGTYVSLWAIHSWSGEQPWTTDSSDYNYPVWLDSSLMTRSISFSSGENYDTSYLQQIHNYPANVSVTSNGVGGHSCKIQTSEEYCTIVLYIPQSFASNYKKLTFCITHSNSAVNCFKIYKSKVIVDIPSGSTTLSSISSKLDDMESDLTSMMEVVENIDATLSSIDSTLTSWAESGGILKDIESWLGNIESETFDIKTSLDNFLSANHADLFAIKNAINNLSPNTDTWNIDPATWLTPMGYDINNFMQDNIATSNYFNSETSYLYNNYPAIRYLIYFGGMGTCLLVLFYALRKR